MTISATDNRIAYTGNGVTTAFSFPYPFHAKANLVVLSTVILTGVTTVKALTTHYLITGSVDALGHYTTGGTITFLVAPASTVRITIYRDPEQTQTMDLQDASSFPAESVEAQHDYQTMLIQRVSDLINRSLRQPDGDAADIGELPSKVDRASRVLSFDSAGDPVMTDLESASGTTVLATGSTTTRTLAERAADWFNVKDYGAVGDDVTDDSAAIMAAANAAGVTGVLYFPDGIYLCNSLALTGSHNVQVWLGWGATLKKNANASLMTITNTADFQMHGFKLNGLHGTYTGKGIVISGASCVRPHFGADVVFTAFTDSPIEIGANSGTYAKVLSTFMPGVGQTDYRAIHVNGPDTVAQHRRFDVIIESGYIDLDGSDSTIITGIFKRVEISSACAVTAVYGGSWGNGGTAVTISGANTVIVGNRLAAAITLDANFSGAFIGNIQTAGTFTDSTVAGAATVHHKSIVTITDYIGKNTLYAYPSGSERIQTSRTASVGDTDQTALVGSIAPVILYATSLTTNRTVTLSNTGAVAGDRFRVSRSAGDTAGPWSVSVGGLKSLLTGTWCDVEFTGAAWVLTAYGTL